MSDVADMARSLEMRWYKDDRIAFAERLGLDLDPWQAQLLTSKEPRILVNVHRQGGKSTVTAVLALHKALYEEGSTILIVSRSQRQSSELFAKVREYYSQLGRPVEAVAEQRTQLELVGGSRIISLPGAEGGASIRGYTADLIVIDEAARVDDALMRAVRPMLIVSGGRLIMLSTPRGKMGGFYEEWEFGEGWRRFHVTADKCPRISPQALDYERRTNPDWYFRQEYFGEFLSSEEQYFSEEDIERIFSEDFDPYIPQTQIPTGE